MIDVNFLYDVSNINNKFKENIPFKRIKYYNINNHRMLISNNQKNYIIKCVNIAHNVLLNLPHTLLNNNKKLDTNNWNFFINKNGVMFNLPYTLDNIIYLPISIINSKNLITTLIHERIHIYQRYNIDIWFNYIQQNTNWKKLEYCYYDGYIDTLIYPNFVIKNPDTIGNFSYKNYFACFIYNVEIKKILIQWFRIEENNKLKKVNCIIFDYEHPFEEFAYYYQNTLI